MNSTPKRAKTSDFLGETKKLNDLLEEQNKLEIEQMNELEALNRRYTIAKKHTAAKIIKSQKRLREVFNLNLDSKNDLPKVDPYQRYRELSSKSNTALTETSILL